MTIPTEVPSRTQGRIATEHTFRTSNAVDLFYRTWAPTVDPGGPPKAIVLFHRGHEHSHRWQQLIDRISLDDFRFFAWDAGGHGRSPGDRGYAPSFGRMVRDADEFVRTSPRHTACPWSRLPSWPRAWAPSWRRPGCTITRLPSGSWSRRRRRCASSCTRLWP